MTTDAINTTADSNLPIGQIKSPKVRDFHAAYRPVLLRTDVKTKLKRFREKLGVANDSHIERCLVTAALEVLLNDPSLHPAWIQQMVLATSEDTRIAFSASPTV